MSTCIPFVNITAKMYCDSIKHLTAYQNMSKETKNDDNYIEAGGTQIHQFPHILDILPQVFLTQYSSDFQLDHS